MLKEKLSSGQATLGAWLTLGSSDIAEIFAKAGVDWVLVDLEHSVIDLSQAADLIRTIDLCGVTPLVRPTSNDPDLIKRVMDAGAHGIIIPMVNSAEEIIKAVNATRFFPDGTRGVGLARAQGYGASFEEYKLWQKDGPVVIAQIEHISALNDLENILSVPGVDAYIIGPYDLSASMGMPGDFGNDKFLGAVAEINLIGKKVGCPPGIHIVEPDEKQLEDALETGYKFIAYSVDIRILQTGIAKGVDTFCKVFK